MNTESSESQPNTDYQRIARAIKFVQANVHRQPTLAEIAAEVQLSEFHFQRVFSRWAGVTPKRYLQALTLERAKQLLSKSPKDSEKNTALQTSLALGLSSSSRLHDHFVTLEAVTPFEYASGGLDLQINFGYHETLLGTVFIAETERGVCQLDFVDSEELSVPLTKLTKNWPRATIQQNQRRTISTIKDIFSNTSSKPSPISVLVKGTNFQLNVWRALLDIQCGDVVSYSHIAHKLGNAKASRAVGSAVGLNPVALLIPCHRVLRMSGELGGYRWGDVRKHAILSREFACLEQS